MFKSIILSIVLLLTGCYQSVSSNDIQRADKFCKSKNQEVVEINAHFGGSEAVICTDGKASGFI